VTFRLDDSVASEQTKTAKGFWKQFSFTDDGLEPGAGRAGFPRSSPSATTSPQAFDATLPTEASCDIPLFTPRRVRTRAERREHNPLGKKRHSGLFLSQRSSFWNQWCPNFEYEYQGEQEDEPFRNKHQLAFKQNAATMERSSPQRKHATAGRSFPPAPKPDLALPEGYLLSVVSSLSA
jgi:hypothetical protein